MRWQQLITRAQAELAEVGIDGGADARIMAEFVAKVTPLPVTEVSDTHCEQFLMLLAQRKKRIPLQHLLGVMYFRYLELEARPGVFIVRPETELVVQVALDYLHKNNFSTPPVVVDLCTGSGAIALAIATEFSQAEVHAVELSEIAYQSALRNNAKYHNLVDLRLGDARSEFVDLLGKVDVVISNPPYVPEYHQLSPEVLQDPQLALYGGGYAGLDIPYAIIKRAAQLLKPGGLLVMEHASEQSMVLREQAETQFTNIITGKDYTGAERWLQGNRI